jgi:Pvc16 N-terminal domain
MSDFRAIAAVSRTLRRLLLDRMTKPAPEITIAPPDVAVTGVSGRRLNLYLFHLTENGFLKNQEIPGHGHAGSYGTPPLSLDLNYLLTTYGSSEEATDADMEAQEILGDAMRVLHDFPIVADSLQIADPADPAVGTPVLDPTLLGDFEKIKIALQPSSVDDFTKIWTALPQASFRRSVAYQVSVVQIESRQPRSYPRPVGELPDAGPRIRVLPFRGIQIKEIRVRRLSDPPTMERTSPYASIGDTLIIRGRNLTADATRVLLGTVDASASITLAEAERIEITVPDDAALQPGSQVITVVHDLFLGDPPVAHRGFQSNAALFMLVPRITALAPNLAVVPRTLQISGARLFAENLDCLTLVGDEMIPSADYTTASATQINFELPASLGSGDHAVRVRVNGAENALPATLHIP